MDRRCQPVRSEVPRLSPAPVEAKWAIPGMVVLVLISLRADLTQASPPSLQRQEELRNLLYQDCGSCHGMRLTGGLGPALTPEALRHSSRARLVAAVRNGRDGTPMPPWRELLSDGDIDWLIDSLIGRGERQ